MIYTILYITPKLSLFKTVIIYSCNKSMNTFIRWIYTKSDRKQMSSVVGFSVGHLPR